ncbi:MAG: hypothetical protein ACJ8DC_12770 [Gemmatimonadales bacterium]
MPSRAIHPISAALLLLLAACSPSTGRVAAGPSPSVEAPALPIASDAAADSLLTDVRSVDSTIQVELRYATANNFTGAPLPGYEAPHAHRDRGPHGHRVRQLHPRRSHRRCQGAGAALPADPGTSDGVGRLRAVPFDRVIR